MSMSIVDELMGLLGERVRGPSAPVRRRQRKPWKRPRRKIINLSPKVSPEVVHDLDELAWAQRDKPEEAMNRVQEATGGGVLSFVVEHTGDLIHRMSEHAQFGCTGDEYVSDKVNKVLRTLKNGYGFVREHMENMESNASYAGVSLTEHMRRVDAALKSYAAEHRKLPVYNRAQFYARKAAVSVGEQNWKAAIHALEKLKKLVDNKDAWLMTYTLHGKKKRS